MVDEADRRRAGRPAGRLSGRVVRPSACVWQAHLYAGPPRADNSGGRTRHFPGSKAGNHYLKVAFSHASIRAIQYNPEILAFFQAKARKKPIRIARTLVALELARIVYEVPTKQEDFDGRFKGRPLSRRKHPQWPRRTSPSA